jgi:hypothetical protein
MSNQNFKQQIGTWLMFRIIQLELQNVVYFKHFVIEIYFNGNFLMCIIFAYTTSNVYLTIRLKF